jgi:transcriptional regulator with XRE-family HTH domain
MFFNNLPNYLRARRKSAHLTQRELASLMGYRTVSNVSRFERFAQTPSLRTALLLAFVFDMPLQELFAGLVQEDLKAIHRRASILYEQIAVRSDTPEDVCKAEFLDDLTRRILGVL